MKSIIKTSHEGERRWFYGGGVHIWKATAEETDGAFTVFEDHLEQGKVTPLHLHPDSDETVFVLEGEILVHVDGAEPRLGAGAMIMNPRGVPHAFTVVSESARLLCLNTPGGPMQDFFFGASESGDSGIVDFERVGASARATGATNILGPPPFAH